LLCIYTIDEAKVLLVTWEMGSSGHDMREVKIINKNGLTFPAISRIQQNNYGSLQQNKVKMPWCIYTRQY